MPTGYLCPPVPGRADYLHSVADLLSAFNKGIIPRGDSIRVLDVGVGASCIYPLIGHYEYGWSFVGSDTDSAALASAKQIINSNGKLSQFVELRQQVGAHILKGLLKTDDCFDLSIPRFMPLWLKPKRAPEESGTI